MGEKVYKPIIKEGDHLIRSKENPDRVRGLTRDENNQNPDIIEWEEYDVDDLQSVSTEFDADEGKTVQLTPEQEEMAQLIGAALAAAIWTGGSIVYHKFILPWWNNSAWPWIKEKCRNIKNSITKEKPGKDVTAQQYEVIEEPIQDKKFADVSLHLDSAFKQFSFEMDEEETQEHMMRLVYHMLGVINEIRIISNALIRKECYSDAQYIELQKTSEKYLSERVAFCFDQMYSNEQLHLDLNTSRELFALTGGGVRLNGEYVPVQADKIDEALKRMPIPEKPKS